MTARHRNIVTFAAWALLMMARFALAEPPSALPVSRTDYEGAIPVLSEFVARYGKGPTNTLFIARAFDGVVPQPSLYAFWKEDNSILVLGPEFFEPLTEADYDWLHTKERIDLKKDVVPTEDDIKGSTYLVSKTWADRIVRACLQGERLVLRKENSHAPPRTERSPSKNVP